MVVVLNTPWVTRCSLLCDMHTWLHSSYWSFPSVLLVPFPLLALVLYTLLVPVFIGLVTLLAALIGFPFFLPHGFSFLQFIQEWTICQALLVRLDICFIGGLAIGSFRISSTLNTVAVLDDVSMPEVLHHSERTRICRVSSRKPWRVQTRDQKSFLDLMGRYQFCENHSLQHCSEKVPVAMPSWVSLRCRLSDNPTRVLSKKVLRCGSREMESIANEYHFP